MEENKSISGEIIPDVPKSSWSFNYRSAFGWGLPVLAGALIGGREIISRELAINSNPVPIIIVVGITIVAFVLGGIKMKSHFINNEMSVTRALFSFKGRISLRDFWLKGVLVLLPFAVLNWIYALTSNMDFEDPDPAFLIVGLVFMLPFLALYIKRLHDRGRSAWFLATLLIPFLNFIFMVWIIVECWFLKGKKGPNKYGPDPYGIPENVFANEKPENANEMECPRFSGQSFCSDDDCPCDNTSIPPATGYLWIRNEVVKTRRNCLTLAEMQRHMSDSGVMVSDFTMIRKKYLPIVVCKRSALMRKLNLQIAHSDFESWVKTGWVLCRETPLV